MRFCLIGATHPCHNPRLVREADSLAARGHEVRVVALAHVPSLAEQDARLIASRSWRLQTVVLHSGTMQTLWLRLSRKLARAGFSMLKRPALAEYAYCPAIAELTEAAVSEPADWYIAHTQPMLPVAAEAARRRGARLGFDCEDLLALAGSDPPEFVRAVERAYVPRCDYVTVTSEAMKQRFQQDFPGTEPRVLYNVFPLKLAEKMIPPEKRLRQGRLRLHWFGQTIGPGKGIEEALEAAALLGDAVEVHFRGQVASGFDVVLRGFERRGVAMHFHPYLHYDDLIGAMGVFDVGLALERPEHGNYSITVTNKFFSYLLAGLAVAATDTPGQREAMEQASGAGFLYPAGRPDLLAEKLHTWWEKRESLLTAQQAAWNAARRRFSWDVEKQNFLEIFMGSEKTPTESASLSVLA
ncbi:MAG: glycosyltransferase [Candidatus Korobacteraceae bacterium]